jgi:hypothetical protein
MAYTKLSPISPGELFLEANLFSSSCKHLAGGAIS